MISSEIKLVMKRQDLDHIVDEKMNCLLAWVTLNPIVLDKTHFRSSDARVVDWYQSIPQAPLGHTKAGTLSFKTQTAQPLYS